jgi:hypothetical protein
MLSPILEALMPEPPRPDRTGFTGTVHNARIFSDGKWYENTTDELSVGPDDELVFMWRGPLYQPHVYKTTAMG